jgi:hypothetical protein
VLVFAPARVAGFYYQPRAFGVVHLVTLGFLSGSILGALYLVAPLAFRLALPARKADWAAFASFGIGTLGMASHFWMDRPVGMLWAAPLPWLAFAWVGGRVARGLPAAPIPAAVKLHVALACANILLAGLLGFLLGFNKLRPTLPLPGFAGVVAHAHLAAVGWVLMMVMGAGYRVLPMFLPSAMPAGGWLWATALVTEAGLLGFVGHALVRAEASAIWAAVIAAGIFSFLSRVVWMLRHRKPAPKQLLRPDWGLAHVFFAMLCLLTSLGLGLYLSAAQPSEHTLQLGKLYGLLALLGFFAQMVIGVEARLLPMAAWLWSFAEGGYVDQPGSQYAWPLRGLQAAGFAAWALGLPLLGYGACAERERWVAVGAGLLLAATLGASLNAAVVLRRARIRTPVDRSAPERPAAR